MANYFVGSGPECIDMFYHQCYNKILLAENFSMLVKGTEKTMPVIFTNHHDEGYLEIRYAGKVADETLVEDYRSFFESGDWIPEYHRLTNLSEGDISELTSGTLKKLADYLISLYRNHNTVSKKTAIYAPKDLHFGFSRMYEIFAEKSTANTHVFRDRDEAIRWIKGNHID